MRNTPKKCSPSTKTISAATRRNSVCAPRKAWLSPKAAAPSRAKTVTIPRENMIEARKARLRTPGANAPSALISDIDAPAI